MPEFNKLSKERLETCDKRLQELFNTVVKRYKCFIIDGYRSIYEQNVVYKSGRSKLLYPDSKHNIEPSEAIDIAPYSYNKEDITNISHFAGYVCRVAQEQGIKLKWGGENGSININDLIHYEIEEWNFPEI